MSSNTLTSERRSPKRLSAKRPPAKSAASDTLEALAENYSFAWVEKQIDQGKKAIWGGGSWEAPLVRACDTIPVAFNELWRDDSLHAEAVAENYHQIPSEFCSMIKAMIGRLHLKKNDKIKRILYFGSTCEPISMVLEHARQDGYDLHCIDAATAFKLDERRDELVAYLVKELHKVAFWLTDKRIDEDKLKDELRRKNIVSGKVRRILDLRLKSPFYLGSIPTLRVLLGSNHYYGNYDKFVRVLDELIAELEEAAKTPETRFHIPLVLAGGGVGGTGLIKAIEESRGFIAGWVIFTTSDYREDIPPLEAIAHYLFDAQLKGELGEGAGASATLRRIRVEELVKKTNARGIISSFVTGCPYGSVVQQLERNHFKKMGVPMVALENTVHNQPPTEEQITKVKTFIEMLS